MTPSNIILTPTGGVKLLDFGVATFKDAVQITKSGTVKGKPAYLAPEQLEGKTIDGRVDLFALGIVMHEMLTLQHLFAGDSDLGTVKKIMEMEIPSPSANRDDVPAALDADRDARAGARSRSAVRDARRRWRARSTISSSRRSCTSTTSPLHRDVDDVAGAPPVPVKPGGRAGGGGAPRSRAAARAMDSA